MMLPHTFSRILIIIVNWNNYTDTIECINSILEVPGKSINVLIIDNASTDLSTQRITEWAYGRQLKFAIVDETINGNEPINDIRLMIMPSKVNHGFGGANNIGIRFALNKKADYLLLLNNDTIVKDGFMEHLLKTAKEMPNAGIIGGLIRYYDKKDKVWFSGGYIDYFKGAFYHRDNECSGQRESDFITGCLMLIPAGVFQKAGLFDERYFLNVEDIDFSQRVKDAGYKLVVNCDAEIYHKVSSTIGGLFSTKNQYYFHRNRMLFFSGRLRGLNKTIFFIFQFVLAIPAWTLIQLIRGNIQSVKGAMFGYVDYLKSNFGKSRYC